MSTKSTITLSSESQSSVLSIAWFNLDMDTFLNFFYFFLSFILQFLRIEDFFDRTIVEFVKGALNSDFDISSSCFLFSSGNGMS